MANYVNELQELIQQIATNGANNEFTANTQATNKIASMEAEIKKLMAVIAQMANKSNNGKNVDPNMSSGNCNIRHPQNKKPHNMCGYCHLDSYPPVGANHTSANCSWKKGQPQGQISVDQHPRWRPILAICKACCDQSAKPRHMEGQISSHQLTGTGDSITYRG